MKTAGLAIHMSKSQIIIYRPVSEMVEALQNYDYEKIGEFVLGVVDLRFNEKYDAYEIQRIYAVKGYGPLLYRVAIQHAGQKGLIPDQTGRVTPAAKRVWHSFYSGKGAQYVDKEPLKDVEFNRNEEEYLRVKLFAKTKINISNAKRMHSIVMKKDRYGEMLTALEEAADVLIRDKIHDIYGDF
jgi:hypothetical protein